MPNVYGAIDLQKNELRQAQIQNAASPGPASPVTGQLWYNTTDSTLYFCSVGGASPTWIAAKAGAGTAAASTVTTQAIGDAPVVGVLTAFAREDHKHGLPAFGGTIAAETSFGIASAVGVATTLARSDHTHGTPAAPTATGTAGGDLTGTYPNPTIGAAKVTPAALANSDFGDFTVAAGVATIDTGAVTTGKILDGTILIGDFNATSVRLDTIAAPTASVALNNQKITGLLDPTNAGDAATKSYVDTQSQGLDAKASVKAASTVQLTLSGTQTVDTIALVALDRVLVKNQTLPQENGIYIVAAGAWTRATDLDNWGEVPAAYVWVEQGGQADTGWLSTADAGGTLGTTAMPWVQFSGAGQITDGAGLVKTGNTLDIRAGNGISLTTPTSDAVNVDTTVIATVTSVNLKADKSITIGTAAGSGLSGGGDLSANRTLAVDYSTAVSGVGTVNVARKYTQALSGTASPETITHGLNTQAVQVTVLNGSSPFTAVEVDWDATAVNTVTVRYAPNLGAGYRIVVVG